MRTRAHFVGRFKHVTVAFRQGVQDNEVQVDLFLAVAVLRRQTISACVGVFGMMNH